MRAPRRALKVDANGIPVRSKIGNSNGGSICQAVKEVAVPIWLSGGACSNDGMKWRQRLAYLRVQEINLTAALERGPPDQCEKHDGINRELKRVKMRIKTAVDGVETYG